jgi:hypothetical protein
VLVRRPDEEKFSIKVIPKVGVDGEYESARQWHRVKSCFRKGSGTILEYNPKKDVVPKLPDGIDPKNLCKLERSQILEQLAFVHQPEELLPRRFRERRKYLPLQNGYNGSAESNSKIHEKSTNGAFLVDGRFASISPDRLVTSSCECDFCLISLIILL